MAVRTASQETGQAHERMQMAGSGSQSQSDSLAMSKKGASAPERRSCWLMRLMASQTSLC
eukprot:1154813-Pyramimonas_sp.AAC.1